MGVARLGSAPSERTDQLNQSDQLDPCIILPRLAGKRGALTVILFAQHGKAGGMGTLIRLIFMIALICKRPMPVWGLLHRSGPIS